MKKYLLAASLMCGLLSNAQIVDIPDAEFKYLLVNNFLTIDSNDDGEIQVEEAENYTGTIELINEEISDLTGLEAFINVQNLFFLGCENITEIDLSNNTELGTFISIGGSLSAIDFSNLVNLTYVEIDSNESLTSVTADYAIIENLTLFNNPVTDVSFTESVFISLDLSGNDLLELDLGTTEVLSLNFENNSNLSYVNLDNGFTESFIGDNYGLEGLEIICIEELGGPLEVEIYDSFGGSPMLSVEENCSIDPNKYLGTVYFDMNEDGCDALDIPLTDVLIHTENGIVNKSVSVEADGSYELRFYSNDADYTTSLVGLPDYFTASPEEVISDFDGFGNTEIVNFCVEATESVDDVMISLVSIFQARPGFSASYQLIYKNMGTNLSSGEISISYDSDKINFTEASETLSSSTANTLLFDYSDLNPFETRVIDLDFLVNEPPTTNIGEILVFESFITPEGIDTHEENNWDIYHEEVIGSYDPNDVTVMEGAQVLIADADEYLHYRIRFQNTGTAEAINVRVENTLDELLDWASLEVLSSSHEHRLEIENDHELAFFFDNINLIDSFTDEPNSHGVIVYRIKPATGVVLGDIIENQAEIYFDFNLPVITNIATTEFVQVITVSVPELTALDYSIYPVPTTDILNINSKTSIARIEVSNELGQLLLSETNANRIDLSTLTKGLYFVKATDANGNSGIQKVIKQ